MSKPAYEHMHEITSLLRDIALSRWVNDDILRYVEIKLPEPIYRHLCADLTAETYVVPLHPEGDSFTFGGIRVSCVPGEYWRLPNYYGVHRE